MNKNQENKESTNEYLTCSEVAKETNMSGQTIRTWIALGKIEPKKCFQVSKFGHWRIHKSVVTKLLQEGH